MYGLEASGRCTPEKIFPPLTGSSPLSSEASKCADLLHESGAIFGERSTAHLQGQDCFNRAHSHQRLIGGKIVLKSHGIYSRVGSGA